MDVITYQVLKNLLMFNYKRVEEAWETLHFLNQAEERMCILISYS